MVEGGLGLPQRFRQGCAYVAAVALNLPKPPSTFSTFLNPIFQNTFLCPQCQVRFFGLFDRQIAQKIKIEYICRANAKGRLSQV
jgi:hypothetical protein